MVLLSSWLFDKGNTQEAIPDASLEISVQWSPAVCYFTAPCALVVNNKANRVDRWEKVALSLHFNLGEIQQQQELAIKKQLQK